jgi:hypothetical protein
VWRAQGWVQVAEAAQDWQAELIALRLRAAGIEAKVVDQTFRQEPLPSVRAFAVVRVLVPEDKEEEARRVLAGPVELPPDAELVSDDGDAAAGEDPGQEKKKERS